MDLSDLTPAERADAYKVAEQIVLSPASSATARELAADVLAQSTIARQKTLAQEVRSGLNAGAGAELVTEPSRMAAESKRRERYLDMVSRSVDWARPEPAYRADPEPAWDEMLWEIADRMPMLVVGMGAGAILAVAAFWIWA